jgi:outer membrane protein OmpA-like peptidoglycan-associated protein
MKRVINLLFTMALLAFVFPVLAQDGEHSLSEIALRKAHRDNWYISIGPSANFLFAEQDYMKPLFSRAKFGGALSIGKWLNQNTGISLNVTSGGLRGFNLTSAASEISPVAYYTGTDRHDYPKGWSKDSPEYQGFKIITSKNGSAGFWQDFNYVTATVDMMANLTNMFRGYDVEKSWFDFIVSAGLGANYAFDNGLTTPDFYWLAGHLALRANFNLTKHVAIYLQQAAYGTDPEFDGYKGTALGDLYTSTSIGLQYTFNRQVSSFQKVTIDELDRLNRRVNENRDLIENHQDILERQQRLLDKLGSSQSSNYSEKNIPIVHKETLRVLPEYVRFALDSYNIDKSEYPKVQGVVDFLKDNPEAKVLLVGYADKKTGNPSYNVGLSKKRVETVLTEIKRLGVSENRLLIEWKGDKEQPFAANEWNRVVIMVERR